MATPSFITALKSDRCIHYLNNTIVNRAQNIDVTANVPTEVINELGNVKHSGIVSAPAEVSLNISVFDTGIDLCQNLTGKTTGTSFGLTDFANAQVDYVGIVRDNLDNCFRSVYVRNACINSVGFGYDVSGNATETYGVLGDNLTVFDGYVLTKTYTIQTSDVTNGYFSIPVLGSEEPIQTKANSYFDGDYLLRVTKLDSGIKANLKEGSDYTYDPASKRISTSDLAVGQVWTVVFYSAAIGSTLAPAFSTGIPAVRGEFTPISIGVTTKSWIPRLQAARINVDLVQKKVPQIGNRQVLFAPGGVPNVSGNFSVLMNDFTLRKLLTYGASSSSETQFGIEQMPAYGAQNDLGLEAVIKSPVDNSVVKRITIPDIVVTNAGMPTTVNGLLTETFSWTGKTGMLAIANS